ELSKLLLTTAQALLRLLPFGYVRAQADMSQKYTAWRETRIGVRTNPSPFPISSADAHLGFELSLFLDSTTAGIHLRLHIVRVNQRAPSISLGLFGTNAKEFLVGAVGKLILAGSVGHPQHGRTAVRHDAETHLAFLQRVLGPFALGNVFDVQNGINRSPA